MGGSEREGKSCDSRWRCYYTASVDGRRVDGKIVSIKHGKLENTWQRGLLGDGMGEKITRVSLTLPQDLLDELDRLLEAQSYASRSEAVRDSLRDFLANYRWRQGLRGERLGVVAVLYEHGVRGLTDTLIDIQHENAGIIKAVQHLHADAKNCLETLIVEGPAEDIRNLAERLGALRGVKQAKLVVV